MLCMLSRYTVRVPAVCRHHSKFCVGKLGQGKIREEERKCFQVEETVSISVKASQRSDPKKNKNKFTLDSNRIIWMWVQVKKWKAFVDLSLIMWSGDLGI